VGGAVPGAKRLHPDQPGSRVCCWHGLLGWFTLSLLPLTIDDTQLNTHSHSPPTFPLSLPPIMCSLYFLLRSGSLFLSFSLSGSFALFDEITFLSYFSSFRLSISFTITLYLFFSLPRSFLYPPLTRKPTLLFYFFLMLFAHTQADTITQ
jgi:hypothetical protein